MNPTDSPDAAFIPGNPHWWQWGTILSLDAPIVAMLWQWLLARTGGVELRWHHILVLGLSVWLAYAADRWLEGWRLAPKQIRTQRHHFYQHHRWPVAAAWLLALFADLGVAFTKLHPREFEIGLLLLVPVCAYLLSHQLIHRHSRWRAPKELCVAILLALGAVIFPLADPGVVLRWMIVPTLLFGLLCFANCALISVWEEAIDRAHGQTSLALQFRRANRFTHALPGVIGAAAVGFALGSQGPRRTAAGWAIVRSVLLVLLDAMESRIGARMARALADVALMTPLAVIIFELTVF